MIAEFDFELFWEDLEKYCTRRKIGLNRLSQRAGMATTSLHAAKINRRMRLDSVVSLMFLMGTTDISRYIKRNANVKEQSPRSTRQDAQTSAKLRGGPPPGK